MLRVMTPDEVLSLIGREFSPLERGAERFRIPTGGELPRNADCCVMLEYAEDYGDGTVGTSKPGAPGMNMIFRGDGVFPGKAVLSKGRTLSDQDIGALAAIGVTECRPKPGHMRDANAPMLCARLELQDGELLVQPARTKSGLIADLAGADGYFCIGRDCEGLPKGEDICAGEMMLPSYTRITPAAVGALIAGGVLSVGGFKRPRVAIIPTGDETVPPCADPKPGDIMEFNSSIFSAMLSEWGAQPVVFPIVPDDYEKIKSAGRRSASACSRMSGVSKTASSSWGATILLWMSFRTCSTAPAGA